MPFWIAAPLIIAAIPLALYLFYAVHRALDACCFWHARRYCDRNRLKINRSRLGPEFDKTGIKTEFTVIDIDCADAQENRRFIRVVVWPFGIRAVLRNEQWNPALDDK
jgi:hypothetical protein